jgi:hypothetical protein
MQDFAPLVRQNQEDVEHSKGDRWNGKEIHRDQVLGVVVEEGLPSLIGASSSRTALSNGGNNLWAGARLYSFNGTGHGTHAAR